MDFPRQRNCINLSGFPQESFRFSGLGMNQEMGKSCPLTSGSAENTSRQVEAKDAFSVLPKFADLKLSFMIHADVCLNFVLNVR